MAYSASIKPDYKSLFHAPKSRRRLRPLHGLIVGLAAATATALYAWTPQQAEATREHRAAALPAAETPQPDPAKPAREQQALALPGQAPSAGSTEQRPAGAQHIVKLAEPRPADQTRPAKATAGESTAAEAAPILPDQPLEWHRVTVKTGDSLAKIFSALDLSALELHQILNLAEETRRLTRIHPGQQLQIQVDADNAVRKLKYEYDRTHALLVTRGDDGFDAREVVREPERVQITATGEIDSSLFVAGQKSGLTDGLIMELAGIFGWDIDFVLDIRKGDRFSVLYEELYLDGEKISNGDILAAEFVNQGRVYRAVRYTKADGDSDYYAPDGKSMRKAFLRTPVSIARISSGFSLGRKHPILNRIRAHKGVDYAASYGTPIKVTGDGKIVFRGTKGGYGRTVIVQHGSRYSTLYAHMSRYARGLNSGSRVKQGEVIGYIGKSGLATGPHLHYEFRIDGVHRNPLTVKLPDAEPLDPRYMADFQTTAEQLLAQLEVEQGSSSQIALNQQ